MRPGAAVLRPLADPGARAVYAALVAVSPQRTVFTGLPFADAVCEAFGLTGRLALAVGAGGAADIGAVLFEKRTGPFRQAVVPPMTPYTGPLLSEGAASHGPDRLVPFLRAITAGYDAVAFHLAPSLTDVRPFVWAGWEVRPRYTYWGTPDLSAASRNVRRTLAAAAPASRDDRATADVVRWAAHAAPGAVAPRPTEALVAALVADGHARVFISDGGRTGAVAVATDGGTGHLWTGGSAPGPAMSTLTAAAVSDLAASGHLAADLAGANLPAVAEFKRRFGLPLVVHYRAAWTGSRVLRIREALRAPRSG